MSSNIENFIVQIIDNEDCEMFIATLDDGGFRFGWKGGPIVDIPVSHANHAEIAATQDMDVIALEWLEGAFEKWLKKIK